MGDMVAKMAHLQGFISLSSNRRQSAGPVYWEGLHGDHNNLPPYASLHIAGEGEESRCGHEAHVGDDLGVMEDSENREEKGDLVRFRLSEACGEIGPAASSVGLPLPTVLCLSTD